MRDDRERLRDILEAIDAIMKYAHRGKIAFESDELIQTWILHYLLILGEAAAGLSESFREQSDHMPWRKIIGMRNILIHHYFGIDLKVVWDVVDIELPKLKEGIEALL
jgi:uncharacterized protein with HEPN domain